MTEINFIRRIRVNIGGRVFEAYKDFEIRGKSPFDNNATPNETKIEILNLNNETAAWIKQGMTVTLEAGYDGDTGVLSVGKVDRVRSTWDGPTKHTSIYYMEGDDYSKIKVDATTATKDTVRYHKDGPKVGDVVEGALAINFKKGTDGHTIIKRLMSALGMKVEGEVRLKQNKIYKNGFSCTKIILNDLEEVINDCGSIIYHRRGKIVVRPMEEGTDENFVLSASTGLIGSPSIETEDGKTIVKARCALQHRITTCSIIEIQSSAVNGKYRVYKGEHVMEKEKFVTEIYMV